MRWSESALDRQVAPELSTLRRCSALDIPEPQDYRAALFLNNVLNGATREDGLLIEVTFIRRWTVAVLEYRSGREHLLKFVSDLPRTNNQTGIFLRALAHFESCAVNTYLGLMASRAMYRLALGTGYPEPFKPKDGSPYERLNAIYNEIKHFAGRLEDGRPLDIPTPVWIVDDGLKCRRKRDGKETDIVLTFEELAAILEDQREAARGLSGSQ
jgi:hypothetical protein